MSDKELQTVIKQLEILRDEAFHNSNKISPVTAAYKSGQYSAYHKAVEIIKKAAKSV